MKACSIFLLMTYFFWSKVALSCAEPDSELFLAPDRLVLNTKFIVLAKAISVKPFKARKNAIIKISRLKEVEFEILEVLKGAETIDGLFINGFVVSNEQTDFDKHNSLEFWGNSLVGNAKSQPDCKMYGQYHIGETYLIYHDITNFKGYERIIDVENDKWLALTKYMINLEKVRNKN